MDVVNSLMGTYFTFYRFLSDHNQIIDQFRFLNLSFFFVFFDFFVEIALVVGDVRKRVSIALFRVQVWLPVILVLIFHLTLVFVDAPDLFISVIFLADSYNFFSHKFSVDADLLLCISFDWKQPLLSTDFEPVLSEGGLLAAESLDPLSLFAVESEQGLA